MSLVDEEIASEELMKDTVPATRGPIGGGLLGGSTKVKPFTIKDSGTRTSFDSGMVRDVTEGKVDYSLVLDGPMFERYAKHLTAGAAKYDKRNWMKANGFAELERFRESALRHMLQWLRGDQDEDHAAAVYFNINGASYVEDRIRANKNL